MANHGRNLRIIIDGIKGDDFLNSVDTNTSIDTAETTVFNSSGRKSFIPGNVDATLSAGGLFQGASSESDQFLNSIIASTEQKVITWFPNKDTLGNFGYGDLIDLTSYGLNSPVDGVISVTLDSQASKSRSRIESLRALSTSNTTGSLAATTISDTADDNTSGTTSGGIAWFQRVDTSTGGMQPFLIHSNNNSTFDTLAAFTTGSTRGGQRVVTAATVKRYVKGTAVLTGSSTLEFKYQFSFIRN